MPHPGANPTEPIRPVESEPINERGAFGAFTVETETMPDGRRIRYYAWPDADRAADPDDPVRATDAPAQRRPDV